MPIQGFTRFRKVQIGKQTVIGTGVAATRARPMRGPILVDPNRTDPDIDTGSLDPVVSPYVTALAWTQSLAGKGIYDELTDTFAYGLKGGVTATVVSSTDQWIYQVASLTADAFEYATQEWYSDTSATDGMKGTGGIINSFELSVGDDLGPFDLTEDWIYATGTMPITATAGLSVTSSPHYIFGADAEVYMNSSAATIGTTKWTDAIHGITFRVNNNVDLKRFANGSNTRFQLSGYGRGPREIEYEFVVAKTSDTMAQKITIDDASVTNQYVEVKVTSPDIISGAIPYSLSLRSGVRLISVTEGEIGGNEILTLTYRAFYDTTLTYALRAVVVNARATL